MRVLGAIMFIVGVLIGVILLFPMLLVIVFQEANRETILTWIAFCLVLFGLPSFLFIFFGARLFRKKKSESQNPQHALRKSGGTSGTIMLTLGIIIGVVLFLPSFIGVLLTEQDKSEVTFQLSISVILFGIPTLLLITNGIKSRRKRRLAAEELEREAWNADVTPAFAPVAASSAFKEAVPENRQPVMSSNLMEMERHTNRKFTEAEPKFVVPKVTPPPKTVVCRSCGAPQNMVLGQEAACEYCGTILKA